MSNVSFGLQSFVFIISLVIVLSADGFTIYLDGGGEFKTLGKDLAALKDDVKELRQSLDSIEKKINGLTTLMNNLSKDLQTMKDNARGSGKACTVKMANERNLKL
ncbi:uncharacterized protein LOC128864971 isoform X2 [Anastrepha ludens]|uniref:uncharacterized protein LOC128863761 n=1 Tax=Anastrepha ludens TaxID=28586 RepID=UPI0023B08E03|nr:uncharacterized protein LOC128863761 [Anastrepha ludens]XP_053960772.1 uncharacterized protein LOC128864971 isoform X2 [Anastrepha ludens]